MVPLSTSAKQALRGPTTCPIQQGIAGLQETSYALCHQVTTLDRSKLTSCIGRLPALELALLDEALKVALSLD